MSIYRIISPIPRGSGSYVFHKMLGDQIRGYQLRLYSPKLEFMPPLIPLAVPLGPADLIHTSPDYAFFFKRPKVPLVLTFHHYMCDGQMDPYSSPLQRLHYRTDLKWFISRSLPLASAITAVSDYTAGHVQSQLGLIDKIKVIRNGVDCHFFYPTVRQTTDKTIRVLFIGNLTRRKGAHWLPAIAHKLKKGILIQYTQGLRTNQTKMTGENIKSLGRPSFRHMPELYGQHDIFLAPTVREGFGLAIAEAMACGLPVVASNCSAIPELVDEGKGGFLCPVGDVAAFAERINLLADSYQLRVDMGAYNRAKIESLFTVERMAREYKNLFEEVLHQS